MECKFKELQNKTEMLEKNKATTNTQEFYTENITHPNLVFKKVNQNDIGEGNNVLKEYVNDVIKTLGLTFCVLAVDILGSLNQLGDNTDQSSLRDNRPLLVTLETEVQHVDVLKHKRNLKNLEKFKHIYT